MFCIKVFSLRYTHTCLFTCLLLSADAKMLVFLLHSAHVLFWWQDIATSAPQIWNSLFCPT